MPISCIPVRRSVITKPLNGRTGRGAGVELRARHQSHRLQVSRARRRTTAADNQQAGKDNQCFRTQFHRSVLCSNRVNHFADDRNETRQRRLYTASTAIEATPIRRVPRVTYPTCVCRYIV